MKDADITGPSHVLEACATHTAPMPYNPVDRSRGGTVETTLTALYPDARVSLNERVSLWGIGGAGTEDLTLYPEGMDPMKNDLSLRMGAGGVKGRVLDGSGPSGIGLNLRSDAMWVETRTAQTEDTIATKGDVSRLRLTLAGEPSFMIGEDTTFTPTGVHSQANAAARFGTTSTPGIDV